MRTILTLALLLITLTLSAQPERYKIKGFYPGRYHPGHVGEENFTVGATISDIEGEIIVYLNEKGICYMVIFKPGELADDTRLYSSDIRIWKESVANAFRIRWLWSGKFDNDKPGYSDGKWTTQNDKHGSNFIILISYNEYFEKPIDGILGIYNKEMSDARDKQTALKSAKSDFQ